MADAKKFETFRNASDYFPSENDYQLVFCEVDGEFRECGHDIKKYANMLLSDYLSEMNLLVSDYTQFIRIIAPDYYLEFRATGSRVRIDYKKREFFSQIP